MTEIPRPSSNPDEPPLIDDGIYPPIDREEQLHEELVTDDKEILGESVHLRRSLRRKTSNVLSDVHRARVKVRDTASLPREAYLSVFRDRNELKIQRLEEKIASDPDAAHHKRDKEWLAMYTARRDHWQGKLGRQASKRNERFKKRISKSQARHESFQSHIDKYIHKKIEAMRKKEFRRMQKEQSIGRLNHGSQAEFFQHLPEAQKRRITMEAILAIREKNIQKGKLGEDHVFEPSEIRRGIDNYERSVR